MRNLAFFAALWLCAFASSAMAQEKPATPTTDDFAFGFVLEPEEGFGIFRTTLPIEVYRHSVQPDLSDMRVFGGPGDVVPHALRPVPQAAKRPEADVSLPFFPLHGENAKPASPLTVEVVVIADDGHTVVRVGSKASTTKEADGAPEAYLLDASALGLSPNSLTLSWNAQPSLVWADLGIEASPDLRNFRPVGGGVIAGLVHAGERLEQRTLTLHLQPGDRYLRLRAKAGSMPTSLSSVTAGFQPSDSKAPVESLPLKAAELEPHILLFDAQGPLPVVELDLKLVEDNTLVRATLLSADSKEGPFVERYAGRFFRLGGRTPLQSPKVELPESVRARYWKLVIDGRGGGVGRSLPTLSLGYRPDEILWVARGQGPFLLAYGSAEAEPASLHADDIVGASDEANIGIAEIGAKKELGGRSRLVPAPPDTTVPWKVYALWSVLTLAAMSVVGLSIRLATRTPPKA